MVISKMEGCRRGKEKKVKKKGKTKQNKQTKTPNKQKPQTNRNKKTRAKEINRESDSVLINSKLSRH
jgi:hypothetical protein